MEEKKNARAKSFKEFSQKHADLQQTAYQIQPRRESLKFFVVYVVLGLLWIRYSDILLATFVKDVTTFMNLQTVKGWVYVLFSGSIFYLIIRAKLKMLKTAVDTSFNGYKALNQMNLELIEKGKELESSEQRYRLIIEGSNDGIWDWNIANNHFFFSIKRKKIFGYEEGELEDTLEAWKSIFHPDDWEKAEADVQEFLDKKSANFESTFRLRCKSGEYRWILSKGKAVFGENGKTQRITGSHTDITEQKKLQDRLNRLAFYDQLTSLPNKMMIKELANQYIQKNTTGKNVFAYVLIDIDDFKHINDTMGHKAGDELIKYVASILKNHTNSPDIVARTGGDEFALLITGIQTEDEVNAKIDPILEHIREPWEYRNLEFFISVSIGVAVYPRDGIDHDTIVQNADTAMTHVKESSKNSYSIYELGMREKAWERMRLISNLKAATLNNEFQLFHQPKYDLNDNTIIGMEALIRWVKPSGELVMPGDFVPLAESTGLISDITGWVLVEAINHLKQWRQLGVSDLTIAVNISSQLITNSALFLYLKSWLKEHSEYLNQLEIEITETALIEDPSKTIDELNQLKEMGIQIALDDFGTGYSSLTYLQQLPIDYVKIDREFIRHIQSDKDDIFLLKSMIDLSHNLGFRVIAEGVENKGQILLLKKYGCDIAQGFFLCKPLPFKEALKLL